MDQANKRIATPSTLKRLGGTLSIPLWLWLGLSTTVAQIPTTTLTGHVLDAKTGEPLPFATVYINNTSRGTTADERGSYRLTNVPMGHQELVGSVVGYQPVRQPLRLVDTQLRTLDLRLEPTQALAIVTVTARRSGAWARQLRTFSRALLGSRPQARQCRISNPDVLSFKEEKGHLRVQANEPLVIDNGAMGYRLYYNLLFFDLYQSKMQFAGTVRFEELPATDARQQASWQASRIKAYQGSLQHLLVNLLAGTHEQAGYLVYRAPLASAAHDQSMPVVGIGDRQYLDKEQAQALFRPASLPFERRLVSNWPLEVYYNRVYAANSPYHDSPYAYSLLLLPKDTLELTTSGGITQGKGLDVRGYLGDDRLATLLPTDWRPTDEGTLRALEVRTGKPGRTDAVVDSLVARRQRDYKHTAPLVYVHTAKTGYMTGDQLWFSAYVLDADRQLPIAGRLGATLQVDLIAPTGRTIQHQWLRLTDGRTAGRFRLADSLHEGPYRLRAYTALDQLSNGPAFECPLVIYQRQQGLDNDVVPPQAAPQRPTLVASAATDSLDVQLLPEGGRWLVGVMSRLGIKALRPDGYGCAVRGHIVDQTGLRIAAFTTNRFGMGQVTMTPTAGHRYRALVTALPDEPQRAVALPAPEAVGWALAADAVSDSTRLAVHVWARGPLSQQPIYITLQSREQLVYAQKWLLAGGEAMFTLSTTSLPPGVCRLTLWDAANQARAERLVYVPERMGSTRMSVSLSKAQYQPREQVAIGLQFRDENGYPLLGSWSVAVTDADQLPADTTQADLRTYLLLASGLRGRIELPAHYLENEQRGELDNLLLTQGWRRLPAPGATGSLEGWTLSGHVRDKRGQPLGDATVVLQLEQAGQKLLRNLLTDADGLFQVSGLLVADTLQVRASVVGQSTALITFDSSGRAFSTCLPAMPARPAMRSFLAAAVARQAAWPGLYRDSSARQLAEVVVRAVKPVSERAMDVQRSSLHNTADGVLDVDRSLAGSVINMFDLIRRTPGVQLIGGQLRVGGISSFGDNTPLYLIDGVYTDYAVVNELNPLDVSRIEVLKNAAASIYGVRAAAGVIAIYLVKDGGKGMATRSGVSTTVVGFTTSREFYTPRYDLAATERISDHRDVLYWHPLRQNDADGQATLVFPLSDTARRLRLVIQGLTNEGTPISATWEVPVR